MGFFPHHNLLGFLVWVDGIQSLDDVVVLRSDEVPEDFVNNHVLFGQVFDFCPVLLEEGVQSWDVGELLEVWVRLVEKLEIFLPVPKLSHRFLLHSFVGPVGLSKL